MKNSFHKILFSVIVFNSFFLCIKTECKKVIRKKNNKNSSVSVDSQKSISKSEIVPSCIEISPDQVDVVLNSKLPVVIDVYADWCSPCSKMTPVFEKVSKELSTEMLFVRLKMESFEDSDLGVKFLKEQYNASIACVPTLLVIKNKTVVDRIEGLQTETDLTKTLRSLLNSPISA